MLGSPVYCHRRSATRRSLSARRWCVGVGANGGSGGAAATRRGVTCIPTRVRLRGRASVTICDEMLCEGLWLEIEHGLWHACTHSSSLSFRFPFVRGASPALDTTSAGPDDDDEGEESPVSSFPAASAASTIWVKMRSEELISGCCEGVFSLFCDAAGKGGGRAGGYTAPFSTSCNDNEEVSRPSGHWIVSLRKSQARVNDSVVMPTRNVQTQKCRLLPRMGSLPTRNQGSR